MVCGTCLGRLLGTHFSTYVPLPLARNDVPGACPTGRPAGAVTSGSSSAVEGSDSGEGGNSMSGASHAASLSESKTLKRRRKRF